MSAVASRAAPAPSKPYDHRRNALLLAGDLALFLTGLAFASPQTLIPAFAERLGAPNVVIGAIPALMGVGWMLPSIFAANHAQGLERKVPFILRYTVFERVPYVLLGVAAIWLAPVSPGLTLVLLMAMLALMTVTGGVLMPAWLDVIGAVVPANLRGRFFALANGAGALFGLGGAAAVSYILDRNGYPVGYGLCFLSGTIFLGLSYLVLSQVREPATTVNPERLPTRDYLRRLPRLLARDRNLTRLVTARAFAVSGQMASGFYAAYALKELGASDSQVGVFTSIVLAAQTLGNFGLGWLADRHGHRLVLAIGALGNLVGAAAALAAGSVAPLYVSFVGMATSMAATNVSGMSIGMDMGPPAERPTYVAIVNSSTAPFQLIAPLLGGLLADAYGYSAPFGASIVLSAIGAAALLLWVRDPPSRSAAD